jgi:hypothetical protein
MSDQLQCQCLRIPVQKGKIKQIESWIAGLSDRENEVIEALRSEGIRDEAVFLMNEGEMSYLYLYSRSKDLMSAGRAFEESSLPVDIEFKQIMAECLDLSNAVPLKLVFSADGSEKTVFAGKPED